MEWAGTSEKETAADTRETDFSVADQLRLQTPGFHDGSSASGESWGDAY